MAGEIREKEKYELYLLHLFVGLIYEEMHELVRLGIPPTGVGHVAPLKKEIQEKILDLFIKMDETIREAAVEMISESMRDEGKDGTKKWIEAMLGEVKRRLSSLGAYGDQMEKVNDLILQIESLMENTDEIESKAISAP